MLFSLTSAKINSGLLSETSIHIITTSWTYKHTGLEILWFHIIINVKSMRFMRSTGFQVLSQHSVVEFRFLWSLLLCKFFQMNSWQFKMSIWCMKSWHFNIPLRVADMLYRNSNCAYWRCIFAGFISGRSCIVVSIRVRHVRCASV